MPLLPTGLPLVLAAVAKPAGVANTARNSKVVLCGSAQMLQVPV